MLGLWVDLGDEMKENWRLGRGLVSEEEEGGRLLNSEGEEGGVWWGILSGFLVLSLGWQKGIGGDEMLRLYQGISGAGRVEDFQILSAPNTGAGVERRPARRQAVNASRKRC